MNTQDHAAPGEVFETMVRTTEKFGDLVQAELRIGQTGAWTEETLAELHHTISACA